MNSPGPSPTPNLITNRSVPDEFPPTSRPRCRGKFHPRNVQRRQRARWAQQEQTTTPAAAAAPTRVADSAPSTGCLDQLAKLGELKTAGILTAAEFEAQKARILAS